MEPIGDDNANPERAHYGMAFWAHLTVLGFFVIAGLVFAADLLIPLTLALLLVMLIVAIVDRAKQSTVFGRPIPGRLAYVLAFGLVMFGLAGILYILSNQAGAVAEAFTRYEARLELLLRRFERLISLQRYVGIKTLVSLFTGIGSYAVMKPVGLDFAETWGVMAFVLNFILTIGSILEVALPRLLALVQYDTFTPFLIIAGGCGAVQFVIRNIVELSLTGRLINLSPLVVVLFLLFWTSIWGLSGALLSVPITVCGLIVISHFSATRPLAILMSGDGTLTTETRGAALSPEGKHMDGPVTKAKQEG